MGRGAWQATVHRGAKQLHTLRHTASQEESSLTLEFLGFKEITLQPQVRFCFPPGSPLCSNLVCLLSFHFTCR